MLHCAPEVTHTVYSKWQLRALINSICLRHAGTEHSEPRGESGRHVAQGQQCSAVVAGDDTKGDEVRLRGVGETGR